MILKLFSLPVEILCHIMSFLNAAELIMFVYSFEETRGFINRVIDSKRKPLTYESDKLKKAIDELNPHEVFVCHNKNNAMYDCLQWRIFEHFSLIDSLKFLSLSVRPMDYGVVRKYTELDNDSMEWINRLNFSSLSSLTSLKFLRLNTYDYSAQDTSKKTLSLKLPSLEHFELGDKFNIEVCNFSQMSNLKTIVIDYAASINIVSLMSIPKCTNLKRLSLTKLFVEENTIDMINRCSRLKQITLVHCYADFRVYKSLSIPSLKTLEIIEGTMNDWKFCKKNYLSNNISQNYIHEIISKTHCNLTEIKLSGSFSLDDVSFLCSSKTLVHVDVDVESTSNWSHAIEFKTSELLSFKFLNKYADVYSDALLICKGIKKNTKLETFITDYSVSRNTFKALSQMTSLTAFGAVYQLDPKPDFNLGALVNLRYLTISFRYDIQIPRTFLAIHKKPMIEILQINKCKLDNLISDIENLKRLMHFDTKTEYSSDWICCIGDSDDFNCPSPVIPLNDSDTIEYIRNQLSYKIIDNSDDIIELQKIFDENNLIINVMAYNDHLIEGIKSLKFFPKRLKKLCSSGILRMTLQTKLSKVFLLSLTVDYDPDENSIETKFFGIDYDNKNVRSVQSISPEIINPIISCGNYIGCLVSNGYECIGYEIDDGQKRLKCDIDDRSIYDTFYSKTTKELKIRNLVKSYWIRNDSVITVNYDTKNHLNKINKKYQSMITVDSSIPLI